MAVVLITIFVIAPSGQIVWKNRDSLQTTSLPLNNENMVSLSSPTSILTVLLI